MKSTPRHAALSLMICLGLTSVAVAQEPAAAAAAPVPAGQPADSGIVDMTAAGTMEQPAAEPAPPPAPAPAPPPAPAQPSPLTPVTEPAAPLLAAAAAYPDPRDIERPNSINFSVLGVIARFRLNYEHMLRRTHGVYLEGIFAPDLIRGFKWVGGGVGMGYRFHWAGPETSGFVGAHLAVEHASGNIELPQADGQPTYRGSATSVTILPHVGKRWMFSNGLNIVLRYGMGYAKIFSDPKANSDPDANDAIDFPLAFDGELSLGYAF